MAAAKARQELKRKATPQDFAGICGMYWEGSAWFDALPVECATQESGDLGKLCPVYACAREREVAHCGVCTDFPCILLVNLAAQSGSGDIRIESAARRAEIGDRRWADWARDQKIWAHSFCPLRNQPVKQA